MSSHPVPLRRKMYRYFISYKRMNSDIWSNKVVDLTELMDGEKSINDVQEDLEKYEYVRIISFQLIKEYRV